MPRKTIKTQLELFPETRSTAATPIPPWQSLPADTRQALRRHGLAGLCVGGSVLTKRATGPALG